MASRWARALTDQDVLVARWRQHPLSLVSTAAPAAIMATIMLLSPAGPGTPVSTILWWLTSLLTIRLGWRVAQWSVDWVIVTNQQVLRVSGLVVRRSEVTRLVHTTGLNWHRSIGGRLLGYGECMLLPAGNHAMHLRFVPDPDRHELILRRLLAGNLEPV